jgi:hypothetical protein
MNDSFELLFFCILGLFSLGIACFISSLDCAIFSKKKRWLRDISVCNFYVMGVFYLLLSLVIICMR